MNAIPDKKVSVEIPPSSFGFDVFITASFLAEAGELIREKFGQRQCLILTDRNISALYQQRLEAILIAAGHTLLPTIVIPAGETSKEFATLWVILEQMFAHGIDRDTVVIAFGGGVIGDIGGLASSLAMRGVPFVQIPTSLIAQVDGAIGGKTGINSAYGKNSVGTYYTPSLVLCDAKLLDSLSERDMLNGYAELLKYGLVRDAAFFAWCLKHGARLLRGDREAQIYAIQRGCEIKRDVLVTKANPIEALALLNFGHTFGQALETITGYGPLLLHGEAVSIGMSLAFQLSVDLGLCPRGDYNDVLEHLKQVGLPTLPPRFPYDIDKLIELMTHDKQARHGKLTLVLTRGVGKAFLNTDVNPSPVRALWQSVLPS